VVGWGPPRLFPCVPDPLGNEERPKSDARYSENAGGIRQTHLPRRAVEVLGNDRYIVALFFSQVYRASNDVRVGEGRASTVTFAPESS